MNQKMKKIVSLLLAFTLVFSMSLTAFAANKATVYYIDDASNTGYQQDLTANLVNVAWVYGNNTTQEYVTIIEYTGSDGYPYFAYYYVNDKAKTYEFDVCNILTDTKAVSSKNVVSYKGMVDFISGEQMNDFTMTPVDSSTDRVTYGKTTLDMAVLYGQDAVNFLASMQEGIEDIQ